MLVMLSSYYLSLRAWYCKYKGHDQHYLSQLGETFNLLSYSVLMCSLQQFEQTSQLIMQRLYIFTIDFEVSTTSRRLFCSYKQNRPVSLQTHVA